MKLDLDTTSHHIGNSSKGDAVALEGLLQVPGLPRDLTLHRCKLGAGLYRILSDLEMMISLFSLQDGAIEVDCDNDAYLRIFNLSYVFDPQQPDYNFLQACCIQSSPIIWS
jgi:hypothetical protein